MEYTHGYKRWVGSIIMEIDRRENKSLEEKVRSILDEIERDRKEAEKKGLRFTAPTKEQIYRKLTKKGSPFIINQTGVSPVHKGQVFLYTVKIYNPDPNSRGNMFVHVFIGPANMVSDVGEALCTVDTRFPRLTMPNELGGLILLPDEIKVLECLMRIPTDVESTTYLGNSFLFYFSLFDVGLCIDRAMWYFEVVDPVAPLPPP